MWCGEALSYPADETWTGIHVRHDEPAEHLDLWLATTDTNLNFARLAVGAAARDIGLANPALRWSGATLYNNGTITYLTTRPVDDDTDELGIPTHGPDADKLNGQVTDLLHHWDQRRPAQPRITASPATTEDNELEAGVRVTRPATRLTIAWWTGAKSAVPSSLWGVVTWETLSAARGSNPGPED